MTLKPGDQLGSAVSSARVIVIRAPGSGRAELTLGGAPLLPADAATTSGAAADGAVGADGADSADGAVGAEPAGQTLIGKRYVDPDATVELLCTASGPGELEFEGRPMTLKAARALPASD
jgi:hypothetical protein